MNSSLTFQSSASLNVSIRLSIHLIESCPPLYNSTPTRQSETSRWRPWPEALYNWYSTIDTEQLSDCDQLTEDSRRQSAATTLRSLNQSSYDALVYSYSNKRPITTSQKTSAGCWLWLYLYILDFYSSVISPQTFTDSCDLLSYLHDHSYYLCCLPTTDHHTDKDHYWRAFIILLLLAPHIWLVTSHLVTELYYEISFQSCD